MSTVTQTKTKKPASTKIKAAAKSKTATKGAAHPSFQEIIKAGSTFRLRSVTC